MEEDLSKSKMAVKPVSKLMLGMGIPIILSMILQAFYNIVDSAFVSNMAQNGEAALNALTLAYPVQLLIVAASEGTGVGINALASKSLGQKDPEKARRVAGNACFLGIIIYIVCILFGIFGVNWYIGTQTGDPLVREMAVSYLRICCVVSLGMVFFPVFEKLLQSTGRSIFSTTAQVIGALTNIVLDPILIYGLLGAPRLGVRGAAWATVIGQIVAFLAAFILHLIHNREIRGGLRYMKPSGEIIREIYAIGLPAIVAMALMSFMTYGLNLILGIMGANPVTAYGLYYKVQQFVLFAAFGLRDTITPIVSFSHGMRDKARIREGIKYGILFTLIVMAIGVAILELFAVPLCGVFGISGGTRQLCVSAMHIISISLFFAGACIAFQGIFQAINCGSQSLVISVCRQILFVLPVAWLLVRVIQNTGAGQSLVWWTFPIAEVATAIIGIFLLRGSYKKKIEPLSSD